MASESMNILLISFDDAVSYWHYKDVFGVELQTPALDEICAQSTAFHAAYCQSPVCNTSRASFMTAQSPHQLGFVDPWDRSKGKIFDFLPVEEMWSHRLKSGGFFCSSGGKVHHGFKPLPPKIHEQLYSDERKGFHIDVSLPASFEKVQTGGMGEGQSTLNPENDDFFYDANSAKSFEEFITSYDGDQPFYREVGFYSPHMPFITPVRFKEMYPLRGIHQPASWDEGFGFGPYAQEKLRRNFEGVRKRYWKKSIRNYFSAYSHGDHNLGKVWRALKQSRFADNTLVIILTDHGMHLGDKQRFGKATLWEQTACVPLIIHDPTDPTPRVVTDPVGLIDVGPTVMDYIGYPEIAQSPGRSLRRAVSEGAADPDRAVPTFNHHGSAIRKGEYRFIQYNDGSTEFFNLSDDWWQQHLLGEDHPDYAAMREAFFECCREYGQEKFPD
ncbi:sulfatase-like hydrolase/transferase [Aestuariivita boseongensis]|uniref:sulfatase-like hydrolase/transferase n=1 Tax=Aestuariivita boseongensis TaxID=1470562 RepID=UPI000682E14C|nr:sulfatase-like hydrolase/transferase [Aestuariivita boseongensis]